MDDDPQVRLAVSRLLNASSYEIRTFDSAREFLDRHDPAPPGCVLLDVTMPEITGLELQQRLLRSGCPRPMVFLTGVADVATSVRAMKAGAVNFLTKPVEDGELFAAIEEALSIDQAERRLRTRRQVINDRLDNLTPRERQVLEHVISGQMNKQIAAELGTAEKTVKVHRARVMQKMGARSVAELVQLVSCVGIVAAVPLRELVSHDFHWSRW